MPCLDPLSPAEYNGQLPLCQLNFDSSTFNLQIIQKYSFIVSCMLKHIKIDMQATRLLTTFCAEHTLSKQKKIPNELD